MSVSAMFLASAKSGIKAQGANLTTVDSQTDAHRLIPNEYLRCAVPQSMGGLGGAPDDLVPLINRLCDTSISAALIYWSQRMAIEFLIHASNVALREYLLPDLLNFDKFATIPFNFENHSLKVSSDGRHAFLSGGVYIATNAPSTGFLLICPIRSEDEEIGWCAIQSSEQGFDLDFHEVGSFANGAQAARIKFRNVFFRGDEMLGEPTLQSHTLKVQNALGVIYEMLLKKSEPI